MFRFRIKPMVAILLLLLIILQYKLWFEPGGVISLLHLHQQIATQQAENAKLQGRNQQLLAQVEKMQQGNPMIETRARHDLGMVKKGESYYQVVNIKEKHHQHPNQ